MKLYELLVKQDKGNELTVWDKEFDTEVYFYNDDYDEWDKAMLQLARLLDVKDISENGVTVNLWDVIEKHIDLINQSDLFTKQVNVYTVMEEIDSILSGNVSEDWLVKFVEILSK